MDRYKFLFLIFVRIQELLVIGSNKSLYNLGINDAVKMISESRYGLHCLLIYPDLKTFREFYTRYIQRQVEVKNEMILFSPFYETAGSVRQNLSMGYIDLKEFHYKSDISLIIADSLNQFFGKVPMTNFKKILVKFALKKKKEGVSILSDMGSYFFKIRYNELIDYELSLPKKFDTQLKGICIYNQLDFESRLTEIQKQEMINHHSLTIKINGMI